MNRNHRELSPVAIGQGLRVKVNANIGTSPDACSLEAELEKLQAAIDAGTDTVMDLSTGGDIDAIRRSILDGSSAPLGSVPIYQASIEARENRGAIVKMTEDDLFEIIERHARDGVDFLTVHCGVTLETVDRLINQGRVADVVSRGGAFMIGWMLHNEKENPLYIGFDRLLDLCREYEVTLSLGDGLRPGCLADATDRPQIQELIILGELVERARQAGVQAMVEGPGHIPLHQIQENVRLEKDLCKGAPFYVLGPIVTDVAPGYDHITAAIGGALAALYGTDFLCYVTPSEHLGLPNPEDVRRGVIASRIAAHAGDIARGRKEAIEWDRMISEARKQLDWDRQRQLSIDPELFKKERDGKKSSTPSVCTMCGEFCALKLVSDYLDGKKNKKSKETIYACD
jgi:phosphomethylpyrimidine synthase